MEEPDQPCSNRTMRANSRVCSQKSRNTWSREVQEPERSNTWRQRPFHTIRTRFRWKFTLPLRRSVSLKALTDPRQLLQWWGQKGMYHGIDWTLDLRPGGKWRCQGSNDANGKPYEVEGEFVEVDPPHRLAYTWVASWSAALQTVVRWELTPAQGGTNVAVKHSGFAAASPDFQAHYQGWLRVTAWMKEFVETGKTIDTR